MDLQNLAYAAIQIVHNFGAVAVTGAALFSLWPASPPPELRRKLAWLALFGWGVQGASGAAFGAVSFAYYGHFPDIHGIAVAALIVKMGCAASGFLLAAAYLRFAPDWTAARQTGAWRALAALAATALVGAAFLRWFS